MARVSDIYGNPRKTTDTAFSQVPTTRYDAFQFVRKLDLYIRCTDLSQVDQFSKSDPLCVLFLKNVGQWCEYGRTESIPNNLNPRVSLFCDFERVLNGLVMTLQGNGQCVHLFTLADIDDN